MEYLSLVGILAAVGVFIFMSMKRFSVYLAAIVAALVLCVFSVLNPYTTLTGAFMGGMSGFLKNYFLLFLVSALFGKVMDESGSARSIALTLARLTRHSKHNQKFFTVLILPVFYSIMSYVGISGFVIAFTVLYIARDLLKELDMPLWFYPYGSAGIQPAYALAGSLATVNIVAAQGFGVPLTAGVALSVVNLVVYYIALAVVIRLDIRTAEKTSEGFFPSGKPLMDAMANKTSLPERDLPGFVQAILPMVVPIVIIAVFHLDAVPSLCIAIVLCLLLNLKKFKSVPATLTEGLSTGINPIINVACANGFGTVIQATSGFAVIATLLGVLPGVLPSVVMMSGMTLAVGSSTAFLASFMEFFQGWMAPLGLTPETCARLLCIAGFTIMPPHNAGVVNGITLSKLEFRKGAWTYFKSTTIPGLCGCVVCVVLVTMGVFR